MFNFLLVRLVSFLSGLNFVLVLPALVLLVLSDVILRATISSPIVWAHELSGLLLLCMFMLAIPKCIEKQELLCVDILYQGLSPAKQRISRCFGYLFLLLFSLVLIWQGSLGACDSFGYGDVAYAIEIPHWPFYVLMAFIGCVACCQSFAFLFHELRPVIQTKDGI